MSEKVNVYYRVGDSVCHAAVNRASLARHMNEGSAAAKKHGHRPGEPIPIISGQGVVLETIYSSDKRAVIHAIEDEFNRNL